MFISFHAFRKVKKKEILQPFAIHFQINSLMHKINVQYLFISWPTPQFNRQYLYWLFIAVQTLAMTIKDKSNQLLKTGYICNGRGHINVCAHQQQLKDVISPVHLKWIDYSRCVQQETSEPNNKSIGLYCSWFSIEKKRKILVCQVSISFSIYLVVLIVVKFWVGLSDPHQLIESPFVQPVPPKRTKRWDWLFDRIKLAHLTVSM